MEEKSDYIKFDVIACCYWRAGQDSNLRPTDSKFNTDMFLRVCLYPTIY